jgi:hypothetical protein
MSGGVRNIYVRECTFIGTDVGLRFKSTRGRGGIVEDIFIENIYMKDIPMEAVRFNMFYDNKAPIPEDDEDDTGPHPGSAAIPVSEETPVFRDIHLKGIYCKGAGQAVILQGLPEMTLKNLVMEDVIISCEKGFLGIDTEQITLRKIDIRPEKGAPFQIYNGREILITEPEVTKSAGPFLKIAGEQSGGIVLRDPTGNLDGTHVQLAKGLSENVVAIEH